MRCRVTIAACIPMMIALCMTPRPAAAFLPSSFAPRLAVQRLFSAASTPRVGATCRLPGLRRDFARHPKMMTAAAQDEGIGEAKDVSNYQAQSKFVQVMQERGFLHSCTNIEEFDKQMKNGVVTAYLGFDATASSLHVGSLLQIMILRHLQKCGHRPVVLVGGGTSKVGDPTGKDESRVQLTDEIIEKNTAGISKVFEKFLDFAPDGTEGGDNPSAAIMVNNNDWLSSLNYMEFLRDYGTQFTINRMLSFESVKQRLSRDSPLSFLEFNYMILQAYDFLELSRRFDVKLQR